MNLVGMEEGGKELLDGEVIEKDRYRERMEERKDENWIQEIRNMYRKERKVKKGVLEYNRDEIERGGRKGDTESDREEIGRKGATAAAGE